MGQPWPLFHLFSVFSNKQYNFYNKSMWKMSIQYMVPGFEPTTFGTCVSSHNHYTRAPAQFFDLFMLAIQNKTIWFHATPRESNSQFLDLLVKQMILIPQ